MLPKFGLLAFLAPATIEAAAAARRAPCGTESPNHEFTKISNGFRAAEAKAGFSSITERATTQVNTYIHIIAADRTYQGGYVDQQTINAQMKMLNDNYSRTGFQFVLRNTSYTVDPYYAKLKNTNDEYQLKANLRQGGYGDLNLYYHTSMWTGNTGWCYYPASVGQGSWEFYRDGCTIHVGTMPGGSYSPWNQGKITSHEVGHWMGLIHTFENGCNGGDYVDDTPASASPTYGCPVGRDSCSQPGVDPIHNFMDYSDNSCQTEFTNGQIQRMRSWFDYYRA